MTPGENAPHKWGGYLLANHHLRELLLPSPSPLCAYQGGWKIKSWISIRKDKLMSDVYLWKVCIVEYIKLNVYLQILMAHIPKDIYLKSWDSYTLTWDEYFRLLFISDWNAQLRYRRMISTYYLTYPTSFSSSHLNVLPSYFSDVTIIWPRYCLSVGVWVNR